MKVLFLTNDISVKHFHMACAMRSVDFETHSMHFLPRGLPIIAALKKLPRYRKAQDVLSRRAWFARDNNLDVAFDSVHRYNPNRMMRMEPDVIYVNGQAGVDAVYWYDSVRTKPTVVYDIEDCALADIDVGGRGKYIKAESAAASDEVVDWVLFGSIGEMQLASEKYCWLVDKQCRVQYPFVSAATIPPMELHKRKRKFTAVYAGSIWKGGYRGPEMFETIAETGLQLHVYMSNDWDKPNFNHMKGLAAKYPNLKLKRRKSFFDVKLCLSTYQVGIFVSGPYMKQHMTIGMKPLEYAYAGVQPVSVGNDHILPIVNLSDGKEYGYRANPDRIKKDFVSRLHYFDTFFHLMENHLHEFRELEK